eukprot:TRINITY_DN28954_c0_g1_i1.p1 TRINITY_DN28954_c0_g1~~TRINITY_DN28954_c0_g1_i1.p1  ORF type:complete len:587 (-),score=82.65 TRINITY_DN28954_c0_g1_i1:487-2247(-)
MNIYTVVAFSSLGGILFGLDQGNWAGAIEKDGFIEGFCYRFLDDPANEELHKNCFKASTMPADYVSFLSWGSSIMQLGAAAGALALAPYITGKFGRREAMCIGSVVATVGNVGQSLTTDIQLFLLCRVIDGVGVGVVTYALPMFVSEISPAEIRGALGSMMQLTCVFGSVVASLLNTQPWFDYRMSFSLPVIPAIIVAAGIFSFPMSPRFAILKYNRQGAPEEGLRCAEASLRILRSSEEEVKAELKELQESCRETEKVRPWSTLYNDPSIRRRVIVANFLQWGQQFTGINAILGYGPTIFKDAGVPLSGLTCALLTNLFNFVFTCVMMYAIDKLGRRTLLLLAGVLMLFFMTLSATRAQMIEATPKNDPSRVTAGWALLFCVCCYMGSFAVGWGGTPWIYPSEIFPMDIKERAMSTSVFSQWTANFIIAYIVPQQVSFMGAWGTFTFYSFSMLGVLSVVYQLVPETKGLELEEMEALFGGASSAREVTTRSHSSGYIESGACGIESLRLASLRHGQSGPVSMEMGKLDAHSESHPRAESRQVLNSQDGQEEAPRERTVTSESVNSQRRRTSSRVVMGPRGTVCLT